MPTDRRHRCREHLIGFVCGQRLRAFALLYGAAALACGGSDTPPQDAPTTDLFHSAEVRTTRLANEPDVVVGLGEDLPLHWVRGAVFLGQNIAIANNGTKEVIVVDGQGQVVSRHGGDGLGPGEYRNLRGIVRHGGGAAAWDAGRSRVVILDTLGRFVSGFQAPLVAGGQLVGSLGESVLIHYGPRGDFPGVDDVPPREERTPERFTILDADDGSHRFDTVVAGEERWVTREQWGRSANLTVIFGRGVVSATAGGHAFVANTDDPAIRVYDERGVGSALELLPVVRRFDPAWAQMVRDTLVRAFESVRPGMPLRRDGPFLERMAELSLTLVPDLPARSSLPMYSGLMGGADGTLWIRSYPAPPDSTVVWAQLDIQGARHELFRVSKHLRIVDFSEDKVLALMLGANGEELVAVFDRVTAS